MAIAISVIAFEDHSSFLPYPFEKNILYSFFMAMYVSIGDIILVAYIFHKSQNNRGATLLT